MSTGHYIVQGATQAGRSGSNPLFEAGCHFNAAFLGFSKVILRIFISLKVLNGFNNDIISEANNILVNIKLKKLN